MNITLKILIFLFLLVGCQRYDLLSEAENTGENQLFYFEVINTTPFDTEKNVAINQPIIIYFNDNIDTSTISNSTIIINNNTSYTFVYNLADKSITLTPDSNFLLFTTYNVTITTGLKNIAGESLETDYSFSFTTTITSEPEFELFYSTMTLINDETIYLGNILNGDTKSYTFTIKNTGLGSLSISSPVLSGTDMSEFAVSTPSLLNLSTGEETDFTLTFNPVSVGDKTITVTIDNNDSSESNFKLNIIVSALATNEPEISLYQNTTLINSPSDLYNIGTVLFGETSDEVTFTIKNTGSANLNISSITISGINNIYFDLNLSVTDFTISQDNETTFGITFTPVVNGAKSATVTILNNDTDEGNFTFIIQGRGAKK